MRNTLESMCLIAFMEAMLVIWLSNNGASSVLAFIGLMLGIAIVYLCEREHNDR